MEDIWDTRIKDFSDLYGILCCGVASVIYLLMKKPNKYVLCLLVMYAVELLLRTTYISIWMYYFKILVLYNAVLVALACAEFYEAKNRLAWLIMPLMLLGCGKFWLFEGLEPGEIDTFDVLKVITHISRNTTSEDIVLGVPGVPFGVFNKNPHYYWFSWNYMGRLDEKYFHYTEPFDINEIIINKKPKYVYYEEFKKKDKEKRPQYAIVLPILFSMYRQEVYDTLFRRNGE